jgi:hypothetical protein
MPRITNSQKKLWGPTGWYLLHQLAFYYQPKNYSTYYNIFHNLLGRTLPCEFCQRHYKRYLQEHPFPSETAQQADIVQWVLDYHNEVNTMTAKSSSIPHVAPTLNQQDLHDLYFVPGGNLNYPPINHQYISGFLKIVRLYHKRNKTISVFRDFIYNISQVFPCYLCQKRLNKRLARVKSGKKAPRIPYIKIMSRHQDNRNLIKKQRIKIKNVP